MENLQIPALIELLNQNSGLTLSAAMGLATAMIVFSLFVVLKGMRGDVRRRVGEVSRAGRQESTSSRFEKRIANENGEDLTELQQQFIHAGYRNVKSVTTYYVAKLLLTLGLPVAVYSLSLFYPELTSKTLFLLAMGAGALGFVAPGMYLDQRVKRRQRAIINGFPDMLDLLVACSEAGLGLNAALLRVAREISLSYPELAHELDTVNLEIRAGVDRMDALKGLGDRTGIDDIRGLVMMLRQSIRFGSGVAETLRIYSEEFRDKRMQRAEEIAGGIGTKMIFPLIFCIFPAFFVVALGPAALRLMEVFGI